MGQYWKLVNLGKREYVTPHKLGAGLKLWEQLASHPGTGAALIVLLAAMPEPRGGGDFDMEENWHGPERQFPQHNITPGPMPEAYSAIAARTIGHWAGDRVALVGDYAEPGDLAPEHHADRIYHLCCTEAEKAEQISYLRQNGKTQEADRLAAEGVYRDVSDDVAAVIEHELQGKFVGEGWRDWKPGNEAA